jgi:hypothetical protein
MEVKDYNPDVMIADCFPGHYQDCYTKTKCERQKEDGKCAYTKTDELEKCLSRDLGCQIGYCGQCMEVKDYSPMMMVMCIFDPLHQCYQDATCKRQDDGKCGFTKTPEIEKCEETTDRGCMRGYCPGQCMEVKDYDPNGPFPSCAYATFMDCYNNAECIRQPNGQCEWTQSTDLTNCLNNSNEVVAEPLPIDTVETPVSEVDVPQVDPGVAPEPAAKPAEESVKAVEEPAAKPVRAKADPSN